MNERDDGQLAERWRAGDADAARSLVLRHAPALRRFFRSKRVDAADDLVQQTFLEVWSGLSGFRGEATFRTFLFCVARNLLCGHYRKLRRARELRSELAAVGDGPCETCDEIRVAALESAVQSLPCELRRVIELAYWDDRTQADIATLLDLPSGTVASRMRRARARLREHLLAESVDA